MYTRAFLTACALSALIAGTATAGEVEDCAPPAHGKALVLRVDATDVMRGIFHVHETVPVSGAGRLVLRYPKWLPGYHAPAGPIGKVGGLLVRADCKPLTWERDPSNVYAFRVEVPAGITAVDVQFQYLSAVTPEQGRIVATPDMVALEWNTVVLYPGDAAASDIEVVPSVKLPAGWKFATALETEQAIREEVAFRPVSLDELVDSPLYAGAHLRHVRLDDSPTSSVWLAVLADEPAQIALSPQVLEAHQRLIREADKLFGARPFERYVFLLTLSDRLGGYGLEHRRSSENSIPSDYLLNWTQSVNEDRTLLPHEYVHSWNGKFRRSAGLMTRDFDVPVSETMLWLYEGLTEYWGYVLAARSGLRSWAHTLDALAALGAAAEHREGRAWRSLADTLHDPIIGHNAPQAWPSWQRGGDYYSEGPLLWLDVDTTIRSLSQGRRSLDDFARLFFGMASARGAPRAYRFEDVTEALHAVQPFDWAAFLGERLKGHNPPLDGLARGGWRLVYRDAPTSFATAVAERGGVVDLSFAIGLVAGEDGVVRQVRWNGPAFEAGLTIGSRIVAVEDGPYSRDSLMQGVAGAASAHRPVRLLVLNGGRYRTVGVGVGEGLRFAHLERLSASTDWLSAILRPRAGH